MEGTRTVCNAASQGDTSSCGPAGADVPFLDFAAQHTEVAVVIDEAWRTGSLAAEVSAQIMEGAFNQLDWPVARVCAAEAPVAYAKQMEDAALPRTETIVRTVQEMFA